MRERRRVTAAGGVDLLTAPRDGRIVKTVPGGTTFELLSEESWLRVRFDDGSVGFLPADFAEPIKGSKSTISEYDSDGSIFIGNTIRCAEGFLPALSTIENLAKRHNLKIYVVSSLREPKQVITGAVVEPARLSNHMVGRAIDMNLVANGQMYGSSELGTVKVQNGAIEGGADLPKAVTTFLSELLAENGLRWGGAFTPPDPVHIDDGFNLSNEQEYYRTFVSLWGSGALKGRV